MHLLCCAVLGRFERYCWLLESCRGGISVDQGEEETGAGRFARLSVPALLPRVWLALPCSADTRTNKRRNAFQYCGNRRSYEETTKGMAEKAREMDTWCSSPSLHVPTWGDTATTPHLPCLIRVVDVLLERSHITITSPKRPPPTVHPCFASPKPDYGVGGLGPSRF